MTMKLLAALVLAVLLAPALAQPRPMPPADRRMSWEERERLREQVRSGQMSREQAREIRRAERSRHTAEQSSPPHLNPEQRERLRRDVLEANRDLERR